MIHIKIGYECGDAIDCDKSKQCKYRAKWYKLHNMQVRIHSFFEYKLHLELPYLFYVSQKWKRLSGTDKCPYHKSRNYTCYECKHSSGVLCRECTCEERNNTPYNERPVVENEWGRQCGYFDKTELETTEKTAIDLALLVFDCKKAQPHLQFEVISVINCLIKNCSNLI